MKSRSVVIGVVLTAVLAGAVFGARYVQAKKFPQNNPAVKATKIRGPENAKITIVEYSDFQCPACRKAEPILSTLMTEYGKDIKFIFKNFPLAMHMWSPLAHQAAECALYQNKYWEYHDRLYNTQEQWSTPVNPTEKFMQFAKDLGLDLDKFASCLSDPAVQTSIAEDKKQGEALQVNSTPTFFINGERLVGPNELYIRGEKSIRQILGLPPKPAPVNPPVPSAAPAAGQVNPAGPQAIPNFTPANPGTQAQAAASAPAAGPQKQ